MSRCQHMQFGPECLSKLCQFASDADAFLDEDGGGGQGGAAGALTAEDQLALLMEVGPHGGGRGSPARFLYLNTELYRVPHACSQSPTTMMPVGAVLSPSYIL